MGFDPPLVSLQEPELGAADRRLFEPLSWRGRFRGEHGMVTVPATPDDPFCTDLASVPQVLTWFIPRYGSYTKAAVTHDFLVDEFDQLVWVPEEGPAEPLRDRADADEIVWTMLGGAGVPWAQKRSMFTAVSWATILTMVRRRAARHRLVDTSPGSSSECGSSDCCRFRSSSPRPLSAC